MIPFLLTAGPWVVLALAWAPAAWLLREGRLGRSTILLGAGMLWVLLVQGESLLGPYARLEWGDGDRLFQGYFPYLALHAGQRFLPELMGGVDRYAVGRIGGEYFSIRLLLLQAMPLWALTVLLRFAVTGVALAGIYLFCRRLAGAPAELAFALGILFSVGFDFTATMPFLYGFSLAGLPFLFYALFTGRWLLFALFGALYVGTSDPIYWLPVLWISSLSLRLWLRPTSDRRALIALTLFSIVWLANYAEMLLAFADLLPWSARGGAAATSLWEAVLRHLNWLFGPAIRYNQGGPIFVLPLVVAVVSGVLARDRATGFAAGGALLIAMLPPFLTSLPWQRFGVSLLASYRWYWEYGAFALALFACARGCAAADRARLTKAVAGGAAALAFAMLLLFKAQILLLTATRGNLTSLTSIPNLAVFADEPAGRVVGVPSRIDPNGLAGVGLATLDGGATLVHRDLHRFWAGGVMRESPGPTRDFLGFGFHPAFEGCCAPLDIDAIADVDLLRLANVGHVISYRALASPRLTRVTGPETQTPPLLMAQLFGPAAPAFVYRLEQPVPLFRPARGVATLPEDAPSGTLFDVLRRDGLAGIAVVRPTDLSALGAVQPGGGAIMVSPRGGGFDIDLGEWRGGVILANFAYLPWWRAVTETGMSLRIVPANLVQMAIAVPGGARSVRLDYHRPLLCERLFAC